MTVNSPPYLYVNVVYTYKGSLGRRLIGKLWNTIHCHVLPLCITLVSLGLREVFDCLKFFLGNFKGSEFYLENFQNFGRFEGSGTDLSFTVYFLAKIKIQSYNLWYLHEKMLMILWLNGFSNLSFKFKKLVILFGRELLTN